MSNSAPKRKTISAGLATMPSRTASLEHVIDAMYPQVDKLYVYLNNFESVPAFLNKPNIEIYRSQEHGDLKDVGKFFALQHINQGFFLTLDDDINYPPDYAKRLIDVIEKLNTPLVVGVHGIILPKYPKSFFDRKVFMFKSRLEVTTPVSFLGTGTCAFDVASVNVPFSIFSSYGMADLHLGAYLKKIGVPALAISRQEGWLTEIGDGDEESSSLYQRTRQSSEPHNTIIRKNAPWGEQDLLKRYANLSNNHMDGRLTYAMNIISACASGKKNILQIPEGISIDRPLINTLPLLKKLADPTTLEKTYLKILNERKAPTLRALALEGLSKINTQLAIKYSRRSIEGSQASAGDKLKHAELCARVELQDEAANYFNEAATHAKQSNDGQDVPYKEILFMQFVFLTSNYDFEQGDKISAELAKTHADHPLFARGMFLIKLTQARHVEANFYLHKFLNGEGRRFRRYRRDLIKILVRLTDSSKFNNGTKIDASLIFNVSNTAADLVDLLKISVMLSDHSSSAACWALLNKNFLSFVAFNTELQWYYRSNVRSISWIDSLTSDDNGAGKFFSKDYHIFHETSALGKSLEKVTGGELISVIMTSYNSERTISYAIESILNQTHCNLELIVVDDFSSDATCEIVKRYLDVDKRVRLFRNLKNVGPYISRNIGIEHCSGSAIAIHDADDAALPNRLELQLNALTETTVAILCSHLRFDSQGCLALENDGSILGHGPMTLMFRRQVIDDIGGFAEVRTRGDKEFECRLEHYYGAHAVKRFTDIVTLCLHTSTSNSHTHTRTPHLRHDLLVFKERYSRLYAMGVFSRNAEKETMNKL